MASTYLSDFFSIRDFDAGDQRFSFGEVVYDCPAIPSTFTVYPTESCDLRLPGSLVPYLKEKKNTSIFVFPTLNSIHKLGTLVRLDSCSPDGKFGRVTGQQRCKILGLHSIRGAQALLVSRLLVLDPPLGDDSLERLPKDFRWGAHLDPRITSGLCARELCDKLKRAWLARGLPPIELPEGSPPSAFAWLALRALPMSSEAKKEIFLSPNCVALLRCELELLKTHLKLQLVCADCGTVFVENEEDLANPFEGRTDGSGCTSHVFVNPAGHSFRVFTAKSLKEGALVEFSGGPPSLDHSWFNGYGWNNMWCTGCGNSLGWKFSAVSQSTLPQLFFAFSEGSVLIESENGGGEAASECNKDFNNA